MLHRAKQTEAKFCYYKWIFTIWES